MNSSKVHGCCAVASKGLSENPGFDLEDDLAQAWIAMQGLIFD
jgi:hypothetical protein